MIRRLLLFLLLAVVPAEAASAGTLSGTVRSLRAGTPAGNYRVNLYDTALSRVTTSVCTAANGAYSFQNLAAGTYKVHFAGGSGEGCTPSTLAPQWYANRVSFQFAEPVVVAEGATVTASTATCRTARRSSAR